MSDLLLLSPLPNAMHIAKLLRGAIESGVPGQSYRYFGHAAENGDGLRCSIIAGSAPLPTAIHLPLIDAIVEEVNKTGTEYVPLARIEQMTAQLGFDMETIPSLCFSVSLEWREATFYNFSAVTSFSLSSGRPKVLAMPSDNVFDHLASMLDDIQPGITFSQRMADLWVGKFNFSEFAPARIRRITKRDYTKRVKGQCYRESALQVIAGLCGVDLTGSDLTGEAEQLILQMLQYADATVKERDFEVSRDLFECDLSRLKMLLQI